VAASHHDATLNNAASSYTTSVDSTIQNRLHLGRGQHPGCLRAVLSPTARRGRLTLADVVQKPSPLRTPAPGPRRGHRAGTCRPTR